MAGGRPSTTVGRHRLPGLHVVVLTICCRNSLAAIQGVGAGLHHSCAWGDGVAVCWGLGYDAALGRRIAAGTGPGQVERLSAIDFGTGRRKVVGASSFHMHGDSTERGSYPGSWPWTLGNMCPAVYLGSERTILEV